MNPNETIPAGDIDRRLPVGDEIFFDHVGHFVSDPEAASRALARAGFTPTPASIQVTPDPGGGPSRPTGTGNVTAMLDRGYLELLFKTADTAIGLQFDAALTRYRGVHLAAFYDWALRDGWPLTLEHLLLVAAGLVFWWAVLGEPKRLSSLGSLAYLGIAFITAPWLSLAYIFASHPYYSFYEDAPRLWGMSPVRDQNLAGILMNAEQTSIFFIALAWMLLKVLAEEDEAQRVQDAAYLEAHGQQLG